MYTYYAFRTMKWHIPKWVQMTLTTLQILQMVIGFFITYKAYKYIQDGASCYVSYTLLSWGFIMSVVYFCLFLHFFLKNYLLNKFSCTAWSLLRTPIGKYEHSISKRVKIDMNDELKKRT